MSVPSGLAKLVGMNGQRIATALGLVAFVVLLFSVGMPALLPPEPVPVVEIIPPSTAPAGRPPSVVDPPDDGDDWDDEWDDDSADSPDDDDSADSPDDDDDDDDDDD